MSRALAYAKTVSALHLRRDAVVVDNATIRSPAPISSLPENSSGGEPEAGRPLANFRLR